MEKTEKEVRELVEMASLDTTMDRESTARCVGRTNCVGSEERLDEAPVQ